MQHPDRGIQRPTSLTSFLSIPQTAASATSEPERSEGVTKAQRAAPARSHESRRVAAGDRSGWEGGYSRARGPSHRSPASRKRQRQQHQSRNEVRVSPKPNAPRPPVPTKAAGLPRAIVRGWEAGVPDGRTGGPSLRSPVSRKQQRQQHQSRNEVRVSPKPNRRARPFPRKPPGCRGRSFGMGSGVPDSRAGGPSLRSPASRKRQRQQHQSRNEVRVSPKPNRRARPFPRKPPGCRGRSFGMGSGVPDSRAGGPSLRSGSDVALMSHLCGVGKSRQATGERRPSFSATPGHPFSRDPSTRSPATRSRPGPGGCVEPARGIPASRGAVFAQQLI